MLIDQEGGRVQRLGPPHWRRYPPGRAYGQIGGNDPLIQREIVRLGARRWPTIWRRWGSTSTASRCWTCPIPAATRSSATAPTRGPRDGRLLGRAAAEGLIAGGVLPVIKHIPGHGRAMADSHLALPVVEASLEDLEARDFVPFKVASDMPMAMTAHVVYAAIDPRAPATTSRKVIPR